MILLNIAGLVDTPDVDTPEGREVLEILEEHALAFLKVGCISLREWAELTPFERAAFVRAQERLDLGEAARQQNSDPFAVLQAYRKFDGGKSFRVAKLSQAVRGAAERLQNG